MKKQYYEISATIPIVFRFIVEGWNENMAMAEAKKAIESSRHLSDLGYTLDLSPGYDDPKDYQIIVEGEVDAEDIDDTGLSVFEDMED